MQVLIIQVIEGVLEELSKTKSISESIFGPIKDAAIVGVSTLIGGLAGGSKGAALGAAAGAGYLGMGYGQNYKPLMTALREDFTVEERNSLYERLWLKLKSSVAGPLNESTVYSTVTQLSKIVQQNPEMMGSIVNELKDTFGQKSLNFRLN